jgi:polyisoprenoid-binding protein YceI
MVLLLLMLSLAACQSGAEEAAPAQEPAAESAVEAPVATEAPASEEPAAEEMATEEPTEEAQAEEAPADTGEAASALQTFVVTQDGSEARFFIDEVLFGQDKTVVGVTSDVSGEIRLDPTNPSASEIGPITINARDLTTDADRRNGAIRRFVLQSERDENQYITFTPTAIANMPDAVTVGETFDFQVTGDLQIREVAREETFDVSVTPVSETELTGLAVTTVLYPDYGLTIPEVPSVTWVADEVRLEFEFTARDQ